MKKEMKELAGIWMVALILIVLVTLLGSCTKYLDAVPDSKLAVPRRLADLEQLLENENMFVGAPAIGEFGTDDLYLTDVLLPAQNVVLRNGYVWAKDIFEGDISLEWNNMYSKVYYANVVLAGIEDLNDAGASPADIGAIRGWALFCRSHAFYDLQQVFGQPYNPGSASVDLGILLRLNTNLAEPASRATVATTYSQIIKDLEEAVQLLPDEFSAVNRGKPNKAACYALLARVYLTMQDYTTALQYAQSSLDLNNTLLDYNQADASLRLPFSMLIDEVLYNSIQLNYAYRNWRVDLELYDLFTVNDLRKVLFFTKNPDNTVLFKGFYTGAAVGFNGLATDEVYLIKAECQARLGLDNLALETLNMLLVTRFKTGTYIPYTMVNTPDVLGLILIERRKECIFRNLRWPDLRRLNQDEKFAKTLIRLVNGVTYQLLPNDPRYTLPIPDGEVRASGIEQNIR